MALHIPSQNLIARERRRYSLYEREANKTDDERLSYELRHDLLTPEDLTPQQRMRIQDRWMQEYLDRLDAQARECYERSVVIEAS